MRKIIIIHRKKVLFRDEAYMNRNYSGKNLDEKINDLINSNNLCGSKPIIIIQDKTIERIIKL